MSHKPPATSHKPPPAQRLLFGFADKRDYLPTRPARQPRLAQWNTIEQTAAYFQITSDDVFELIFSRELKARRIRGEYRIAKQSIRLFVAHTDVEKPTKADKQARRKAVAACIEAIRGALAKTGTPGKAGAPSKGVPVFADDVAKALDAYERGEPTPARIAECVAALDAAMTRMYPTSPKPMTGRQAHRLASAIWAAVAPVVRANRDEL